MAALAAVFSLARTINDLIDCYNSTPLDETSEIIMRKAHEEVEDLQLYLSQFNWPISRSSKLKALSGRIADMAHHLEDVIDSQVSNHVLLSQSGKSSIHKGSILKFLLDSEEVKKEIVSFTEMARKMKEEYNKEMDIALIEEVEEDDDDDDDSYSNSDFGIGKKPIHMVGFSDQLKKIEVDILQPVKLVRESCLFWFVGERGSGRTILARSIFDDLYNDPEQHFDHMAWVTVGPNLQWQRTILSVLAQIEDRQGSDKSLIWEEDGEIVHYLRERLSGKKYCIVLDDIPDEFAIDISIFFPHEDNGSLLLQTTNRRVGVSSPFRFDGYEMPILSTEKCWDIIREKVFAQEPCPPELEEPGKKIANNCQGLVLAIIKVAVFLSKAEKTPEYWNKLAADKQNAIFIVAEDEISEVNKIKQDLKFWKCFFDDGDHGDFSPKIDFICIISSIIGSSYGIERIKRYFIRDGKFPGLKVVALSGMAGIGKTTLAKEIFKDPSIVHGFDHRVWITLGPKYRIKNIFIDVLSQIYPNITKNCIDGEEIVAKNLCLKLFYKTCLIVLDDVWDIGALYYLPGYIKGSILITSTKEEIHCFVEVKNHKVQLLDKEESWHLLHDKVFVEEPCPHELVKAGKKIAEKCDGLPLLIVAVAELLCKAERTPTYWNQVAEKEKLLFTNAFNKVSVHLFQRYDCLGQPSKLCFLYMSVFPQKYEVSTSQLSNLWRSEGCAWLKNHKNNIELVEWILNDLRGKNLIMITHHTSKGGIKRCRLHSVFWYLSNREARKNKFFHALSSHVDSLLDDLQGIRRLSIRNNILFCIKDVRNSLASASNARSLLCTGPPHLYPVPIYLSLKMLRVLDALTIRFYNFPIKVLELIHLRYLAFTYNGNIPSSISKLWKLELLIIHQHQIIRSHEIPCYLPMEIWDMKELKHLQIMGNSLPNPNGGALLEKLTTFLDVSAQSCTKAVFGNMSHLEKLGIRIEFAPEAAQMFNSFNDVVCLHKLSSLKCVIVNPDFTVDAPVAPPPLFPLSLTKLTLCGFGYPWKYMRIIGQLEYLKVLKLRCYAFRGHEWETYQGEFKQLEYLLLEDTDLVYWKAEDVYFPRLKHILFGQCYKLKEIPLNLPVDCIVNLVDCNPELENK